MRALGGLARPGLALVVCAQLLHLHAVGSEEADGDGGKWSEPMDKNQAGAGDRERRIPPACAVFPPPPLKELGDVVGPIAKPIIAAVCNYLGSTPRPRRLSLGRWNWEIAALFEPHVQVIDATLGAEQGNVMASKSWAYLQMWLDKIAFNTHVYEIRALSAPITEEMLFAITDLFGVLGTASFDVPNAGDNEQGISKVTHLAMKAIQAYKQAGRDDRAQACFQRSELALPSSPPFAAES